MALAVADRLRVRGEVTFWLVAGELDPREIERVISGERVAQRVVRRNLVTNVGRIQIVKRITDQAGVTSPTHIALGTTVITPAVTHTTLAGETFRKACSTVAPFQSYFARYVATLQTTEANGTLRGAGLFDAATAGNMWAEVAINIVKTSASTLVVEHKIEVKL